MSGAGSILVFGPAGPAIADLSSQADPQAARLAAVEAAVAALDGRVAVIEGRAVAVGLTGTLPVATVQLGTLDVSVLVPNLLRSDTVVVEVEADLPPGLDLRAWHPDRTRDGVLIVQLVAAAAVAIPAAIPLRVTALRTP